MIKMMMVFFIWVLPLRLAIIPQFRILCQLAFFIESSIIGFMRQIFARYGISKAVWSKLLFAAVGLLLLGWLLDTPPGLLGKADAIGYAVCHRIDVRSYHLGVRQIPLCARCTGMYLGAMLGLVYQDLVGRRRVGTPPIRVIVVLVGLVLAFAFDGINSYLSLFPGFPHLYEPQNWLRLLTGTGMGLAITAALFPAFNLTIWHQVDKRPSLVGLKSLALLFVAALAIDLIVLSENPLLLYPLALISAAGVLVLLTMVYSMVWVMMLNTENHYTLIQQLILPLTAGFGSAMVQIILLDVGRYLLTGTWDGFHIG
jgi:uncharacterized membrane protein